MLDFRAWGRSVAGSNQKFIFGTSINESGTEAMSNLTDEQMMTCIPFLPGYSLELKRWGLFPVSNVTVVTYNDKAFHRLVLSEQNKKLISSLLMRHDNRQDDKFDDLISGKGKGLIFLLHGPPGVGKTYTAGSYYPSDNDWKITQLKCRMTTREHSGPYRSTFTENWCH